MVCWLVGGKCVKEKLSQINIKHSQTLPNIKGDQYKQLLHQPYPSQTSPDASDQVSKNPNFDRFQNPCIWLTKKSCQISTSSESNETRNIRYHMDGVLWAKRRGHNIERWRSLTDSPDFSLSLFQEKAEGGVGGSVGRCSLVNFKVGPWDLKWSDTIWMECSEPKDWVIILKDGRVELRGNISSYHYFRIRRNGLLAGRWQMCQREVVPDQH